MWHLLTIIALAGVVLESVVLVALMRQVGGLLLHTRPPRPGALPGGPTEGAIATGLEKTTLTAPAVVLFTTPTCSACKPLLPLLPIIRKHYPEVQLRAAVGGDDGVVRIDYIRELGPFAAPELSTLFELWDIPATPFAVGLRDDGRVGPSGVVNTLDQFEALIEQLVVPVGTDSDQGDGSAPKSHNGHHRLEVLSPSQTKEGGRQ